MVLGGGCWRGPPESHWNVTLCMAEGAQGLQGSSVGAQVRPPWTAVHSSDVHIGRTKLDDLGALSVGRCEDGLVFDGVEVMFVVEEQMVHVLAQAQTRPWTAKPWRRCAFKSS